MFNVYKHDRQQNEIKESLELTHKTEKLNKSLLGKSYSSSSYH